MIVVRDECVGCPSEMGCMGSSCPYMNVEVAVCDNCGEDAVYNIDGYDYCEDHATDYLMSEFESLSLREQSEVAIGEYNVFCNGEICKYCKTNPATINIEGDCFCNDCAKYELMDRFGSYSIEEQAEYLGQNFERI